MIEDITPEKKCEHIYGMAWIEGCWYFEYDKEDIQKGDFVFNYCPTCGAKL